MHRTAYLGIFALAASLAAGNVRGAEESSAASGTDDNAPRTSNMESWQEEERKDSWTWFGMGYESRRSTADTHGSGSPAGTPGKGGPGGKRQ